MLMRMIIIITRRTNSKGVRPYSWNYIRGYADVNGNPIKALKIIYKLLAEIEKTLELILQTAAETEEEKEVAREAA